eukprot:12431477-Karenia_brevis.AAC.1
MSTNTTWLGIAPLGFVNALVQKQATIKDVLDKQLNEHKISATEHINLCNALNAFCEDNSAALPEEVRSNYVQDWIKYLRASQGLTIICILQSSPRPKKFEAFLNELAINVIVRHVNKQQRQKRQRTA